MFRTLEPAVRGQRFRQDIVCPFGERSPIDRTTGKGRKAFALSQVVNKGTHNARIREQIVNERAEDLAFAIDGPLRSGAGFVGWSGATIMRNARMNLVPFDRPGTAQEILCSWLVMSLCEGLVGEKLHVDIEKPETLHAAQVRFKAVGITEVVCKDLVPAADTNDRYAPGQFMKTRRQPHTVQMRKVSSRVLGAGYDNRVGESQAIRISHVSDLHPAFVGEEVQIVRVGNMREVQNRNINVKVA